jgi:phosphate starvation-inducible PhoH-like protein
MISSVTRDLFMKRDGSKSLSLFYKPKTPNQKQYDLYLKDPGVKIIFAIGPAGSGKTLLACNHAIQELKAGNTRKIIITRPVVPVEEDIGFLPGNINKKMDPWTRPIIDIFLEFYSQKEIDVMMQNSIIEISPLAYMRGRTFKNSFIIADEMQNSSPNQMLMLTTRFGENSKMIITGDLKQTDKGIFSGLHDFLEKFRLFQVKNQEEEIKIVEMTKNDIKRDRIVSKILDIYESDGSSQIVNSYYERVEKKEINETSVVLEGNGDCAIFPRGYESKRL